MFPEKRLSFTPLPAAQPSLMNSTANTKVESCEEPLYAHNTSPDKFEA